MTSVAIKGDVEGIVRRPGATEVLVAEGLGSSAYALDELLVDFGAALEDLVSWPAVVGGCTAAQFVSAAQPWPAACRCGSALLLQSCRRQHVQHVHLTQLQPPHRAATTSPPQDLARALATLEPLELTPETEAQWAALGALALQAATGSH